MKFTCLPENLIDALSYVSRIPPNRTTLPILSCIHLKAEGGFVRVEATDLNISVGLVVDATVETEGECAVPARILIDLVSTFSPDEVMQFEYNPENLSLNLKSGKTKSKIKGIDPQEFPLVKLLKDEVENTVTIPHDQFRKSVREVVIATASDESRPVLTGVHLIVKNGNVILEGADGFRLSRSIFSLETDWEEEAIIPARAFIEFLKSNNDGDVKIGIVENRAVLIGDNSKLVSQRIEGNYPDVEAIIPGSSKTRVVLSTKGLVQSIKAAMVFARESNNTVYFGFKDNHVTVTATSAETGENDSEVGATISGPDIEIALNGKYLLDVLSLPSENTVFEINEKTSPIVVKDAGNEGFIHLIMPMHL